MRNRFTEKEISLLKDKYLVHGGNIRYLLKRHDIKTIYNKARELGIKKQHMVRWTKEEIKILMNEYPQKSGDIPKLLEKHNRYSITKKAQYLKVTFKGREHNKCVTITPDIQSIIDGLLLGDGWIGTRNDKTAYLVIHQTESHKKWLEELKKIFEKNGILCSEITLKRTSMNKHIMGKKEAMCKPMFGFNTNFYVPLISYRRRWYPNEKKMIPSDVDLSPLALSQWYMGDGCLHVGRIQLATMGFKKEEVELLSKKINKLYNWHSKVYVNLELNKKKEVSEFLKLTEPYKIHCFNYKWRQL